jgi:hypothetical protein
VSKTWRKSKFYIGKKRRIFMDNIKECTKQRRRRRWNLFRYGENRCIPLQSYKCLQAENMQYILTKKSYLADIA